MKALILAHLGKAHFINGNYLPTCFLPIHNNMTVLERQISLLNINGFKNDEICVVFGSDGIWSTDIVRKRINALYVNTVSVDGKYESENHYLQNFLSNEDFLLIEGNKVFDLAIIARLLRFHKKDVIVTDDAFSPDDLTCSVELVDDKVVSLCNVNNVTYPWNNFAGICKFSSPTVKKIKESNIKKLTVGNLINDLITDTDIYAIKYNDLVYGIINSGHTTELLGGSYSKINYRLVVKKEDEGSGREKLINEITWLLSLPNELKPYFSQVLEYDIKSKKVYYNVPYYGSRNLREHIFMGQFDSNDAIKFLDNLLTWMFNNVYCRKISNKTRNWVMNKHINRVLDRLPECAQKSETLGQIISAKKLVINGKAYRNVEELFIRLSHMSDFIDRINPKELVMIHGDLHFQNILIYNYNDTGFMLVDPRGEHHGSDIYYDMGKLWHSFHGKYDFIHTDQFTYRLEWNDDIPVVNFEITNQFVSRVYDEIYAKFLKLIPKFDYFKNDPDWEMKALFAEACHFCSVSTFHVSKTNTSDREVVLYLTGVILINEFFEKYIDGYEMI